MDLIIYKCSGWEVIHAHLLLCIFIDMYNPYSNNYISYTSSQMLNPLEPGLSYPSSPPPPPPVHSVFANYDYGYYQQQQAISNRQHTPTGQPERMSGSSKRKMEDQVPSSSPLSSTSCSSSASFPEENDRAPSVKRSRRVAPKTARRQSSTNTTVSEDSESDEAESRQRSLERNRLAGMAEPKESVSIH